MHKVVPRNLLIIFYKDSVLLQRGNPSKRHWANTFNGLGGHVEPYEEMYASALRELREESGIHVDIKKLKLKGIMHVYTYFKEHVNMFIFTADIQKPGFIDSDEGTLEWVKISEIPNILNIAEDVKIIIPELRNLKHGQIISGTSKYNINRKLTKFEYSILNT